jgi:nucleoside-diphosphate-sugar epimerase
MRFDIVLNNLAGLAWTTNAIRMISDGTPWRPLVHVLDICHAIECALTAPDSAVKGEVFNVGHNEDNFQVRDIATIVGEVFTGCELSFGAPSGDNRSYRVSFDKIARSLPGFQCKWNARAGAEQLRNLFERIQLEQPTFESRRHTRLKMLRYLIESAQIDDKFYWSLD